MGQPTLLLVDDEADLLSSLRMDLEGQGYRVLTALDGESALEIARRELPDLLLLDLMLPQLDGYHILKFLKSDERYRKIPVLVITVRADAQDLMLALECGANECLVKPVQREPLLERIHALAHQQAPNGAVQ